VPKNLATVPTSNVTKTYHYVATNAEILSAGYLEAIELFGLTAGTITLGVSYLSCVRFTNQDFIKIDL
jgi:hypothetical protein